MFGHKQPIGDGLIYSSQGAFWNVKCKMSMPATVCIPVYNAHCTSDNACCWIFMQWKALAAGHYNHSPQGSTFGFWV
jgi:hypothetical protein